MNLCFESFADDFVTESPLLGGVADLVLARLALFAVIHLGAQAAPPVAEGLAGVLNREELKHPTVIRDRAFPAVH